jgi:DNA-binding transcriptional LysR family regulator
MDTQALQAFVTVAEQGSFTAAADRLFLTQPAVSKRIALLEGQLHARLFDRVGRRVALTEAGEALLPRARRILVELEDTERAIDNLSGAVAGRLRIGTSHHIGLHRLPPVLRRFSAAWPEVRLDIRFVDSEEAYQAVMQGELELGLVTLPPRTEPGTETRVIWHDPLVFMAAPDHPLADGPLALEALARHPALLPSPATFTRRIVEGLFREQGLQLTVSMSTNYLETIHMMVSVGLGWSVLPATMLDDRVQVLELPGVALSRDLGVVRHPARSLSNAAGRFLEVLEETAQTEPAG